MRHLIKKAIISTLSLVAVSLAISCGRADNTDQKIRESIERHLSNYPQSTLRDIYKNFFQDNFGPGHIISNKAAADKYLRLELEANDSFLGADYELTGYEGRFYRVNLGVIKDGRVDYDKYFDAFIRSVNGIEQPTIEHWRKEWHKIDSVIISMNLKLPFAEQDRATIDSMLNAGNAVMHHSSLFNKHYAPHYRIIERNIFHNEILPLINKR